MMTTAAVQTDKMKADNLDQQPHKIETKDQIVPPEELEVDLVVQTADLGTKEEETLVAVDLRIALKEVARVNLSEAAELIDILKDRKFQ